MRKCATILLLLFLAQAAFAQNGVVSGIVTDTASSKNLSNAVVALLQKKDSVLYQFCRTNAQGAFQLKNIPAGSYIVLVSFPKFADYLDVIEVKEAPLNLGAIALTSKAQLMEEVVIRQNMAIRVKGDTIEYRADSFQVAQGASVKEMLRKMPGLQVDKNGQVTAQGQKVEKILVDGEEFFSDDPAVVIENLRADAIEKVQSYDKKSEQAEFTGVDDGTRSKTLNLVLKEDKKRGMMGKIVLGGGTEERYSTQAMLNYFKGKKKLSVYGISSNTGVTGLDFSDRSQFGQGLDLDEGNVEMGAGFIMITSSDDDLGDDWSSNFYGEGIPKTYKAGLHYSDAWSAKQKFNGNYSLKNQQVNAVGNSLYKYLLPDSAYYSRESHTGKTLQRQHLVSTTYSLTLNDRTSFRLKLNGLFATNENESNTQSQTEDEDLKVVNHNGRINTASIDNKTFAGSLLWRQKFNKKGRTLSLSTSYRNADQQSAGYLFSETSYFDASGVVTHTDSVNQRKTIEGLKTNTKARLVYTEPAGLKSIIEVNYTFNNLTSTADRKTFEKNGNDKYDILNNALSNAYELVFDLNSAGVKYQYNSAKLMMNFGSNIGVSSYRQKDIGTSQVRKMSYTNLFPSAAITYKIGPQKNLRFNYSGSPTTPTVEQIQPVRENINPLFITIGNPLLGQGFSQNLSLSYNQFATLSGRSIWVHTNFNTTHNAIVTSQQVNNGITTQQFVNADGNYRFSAYINYGVKLGKSNTRLGFNTDLSTSRYVNFINSVKSNNNNLSVSFGPELYGYKEDKYDWQLRPTLTYTRSRSNISTLKTSYWEQEYEVRGNYFITKRLQLGTDAALNFRQKTDAFTGNNNFIIWNANVQYRVFKNRNGIIKLEVNDLLNQKVGFSRDVNANYIYERHYNTLGQYALLSFTWNFNKNFGTATK